MKRLLISLICVLPLLILPTTSQSLDLTGPDQETLLSSERYGPTEASDTLWAIATQYSDDNTASVYQALLAIYKSNPHVFEKGNANWIFPHSTLIIPPLEFMKVQKNRDAQALLKKYNRREPPVKKAFIAEKKPEINKAKESIVNVEQIVANVDDETVKPNADNQLNAERQAQHEQELTTLNLANEQLASKNSALLQEIASQKLEIESLHENKNKLLALHSELQSEANAVVKSPFAGDGVVNEMLRFITGSLMALLATILLPLLILITIFALISRKQSKKQQQQEQELAESTDHTIDDASEFDSLLADETEALVLEDDLSADFNVSSDATDVVDGVIIEEEAPSVDVEVVEEVAPQINEDELDPFGLGELTVEEVNEADEKIEPKEDLDLAAQWEQELANDELLKLTENNTDNVDENGLLAAQLSESAFNEDAALPTIDENEKNDFIDIETLLENSEAKEEGESDLYFTLDFELEEFPDVVNVGESIDIDDDEGGVSAQLDLARAYLEIDDKAGAKEILSEIVEKSEGKQRIEIDKLLAKIS